MKILWLTEDFRGIKRFLSGEIDYDEGMPAQYNPLIYFAKRGHQIDIVSPGTANISEINLLDNITSTIYKKPASNFISNLGWGDVRVRFFLQIYKSLKTVLKLFKNKPKYDIIYSHWEFQSIVGSILSYYTKIPNIIRLYGSNLYGRTGGRLTLKNKILHLNRYLPFLVRQELMIITMDGTRADDIYKIIHGNTQKMIVLLNGVDNTSFTGDYKQKYSLLNGKFVISFIGRVEGWKRTDLFVDTLSEIVRQIPEVLYLIVGGGNMINRIKEKVHESGLKSYIRFTGQVSQDERKYLMESSDIYASMYEYSNLSNTFIEAINTGIPSLIIPNGKTTFLAHDKVNCLFINENNCRDSLIEKIIYLYNNKKQMNYLRKSSKEFARLNFMSWEERSMIEINLFEEINKKGYYENMG